MLFYFFEIIKKKIKYEKNFLKYIKDNYIIYDKMIYNQILF